MKKTHINIPKSLMKTLRKKPFFGFLPHCLFIDFMERSMDNEGSFSFYPEVLSLEMGSEFPKRRIISLTKLFHKKKLIELKIHNTKFFIKIIDKEFIYYNFGEHEF